MATDFVGQILNAQQETPPKSDVDFVGSILGRSTEAPVLPSASTQHDFVKGILDSGPKPTVSATTTPERDFVGDILSAQPAAPALDINRVPGMEPPRGVEVPKPRPEQASIGETLKTFGKGMYGAAADVFPKTLAEAYRAGKGVDQPSYAANVIERNKKQMEERELSYRDQTKRVLPGLNLGQLKRGLENFGYSWASAFAGMAAGAAATGANPDPRLKVLGAAIGAGALQGTMAYRATKDQYVSAVYENLKRDDPNLTPEQWKAMREAIEDDSMLQGLWEAIPEAAGAAISAGLLRTPIAAGIKKAIPLIKSGITRSLLSAGIKFGGMLTEELATEGLTEYKQSRLEAKHGIRTPEQVPETYGQAVRNVAAEVTVMTAVAAAFGGALNRRLPPVMNANRVEEMAKRDVGAENVTRVDENTVQLNTPAGKTIQIKMEKPPAPDTPEKATAWLNSLSSRDPVLQQIVTAKLVTNQNNPVAAVDELSREGFAEIGSTEHNVVVTDPSTGESVTIDSLVRLAPEQADVGTYAHEKWHTVKRLAGVTDAEQAALAREFASEEEEALMMERVMRYEAEHPILSRVREWIMSLLKSMRMSDTETAADVIRRIQASAQQRLLGEGTTGDGPVMVRPAENAPAAAIPPATPSVETTPSESAQGPRPTPQAPPARQAVSEPVTPVVPAKGGASLPAFTGKIAIRMSPAQIRKAKFKDLRYAAKNSTYSDGQSVWDASPRHDGQSLRTALIEHRKAYMAAEGKKERAPMSSQQKAKLSKMMRERMANKAEKSQVEYYAGQEYMAVKDGPTRQINESELADGDYVRIGEEWFKVVASEQGKTLKDGTTIRLDDFESVDAKGVIPEDHPMNDVVGEEYKRQEAMNRDERAARDDQSQAQMEADAARDAARLPAVAPVAKPAVAPVGHVAIYNEKEIPADSFKLAAQRVSDNLSTGEHGYVRTPSGKLYEISSDRKTAVPVAEMRTKAQRDISVMEERIAKSKHENERKVLTERLDAMKAAIAPVAKPAAPAVNPRTGQSELLRQDEGGFRLVQEDAKIAKGKRDAGPEMFTAAEQRGRALDDLDAKGMNALKVQATREGIDMTGVAENAERMKDAIREARRAKQAESSPESTPRSPESTPAPKSPAAPRTVRIGKSPQPHTVLRELDPQPGDAPGERYFEVRNDKTGEMDIVESGDMRDVRERSGPAKGQTAGEAAQGKPLSSDAVARLLGELTMLQKARREAVSDETRNRILEKEQRVAEKLRGGDVAYSVGVVTPEQDARFRELTKTWTPGGGASPISATKDGPYRRDAAGAQYDGYSIRENGKWIGDLTLRIDPDGTATIGQITMGGGKRSIGVSGVKAIRNAIKRDYPQVNKWAGDRTTGTRAGKDAQRTEVSDTRDVTPADIPAAWAAWKSAHPSEYAELEKMRADVLKAQGYTVGPIHTAETKGPIPNVVDAERLYLTDSRDEAGLYSKSDIGTGKIRSFFVNIRNPKVLNRHHTHFGLEAGRKDVARWRAEGFDGVVMPSEGKAWGMPEFESTLNYLAFDPSQIKSSEVTPDDTGRIPPPSEWGDATQPDIRYSVASLARDAHDKLTAMRAARGAIDETGSAAAFNSFQKWFWGWVAFGDAASRNPAFYREAMRTRHAVAATAQTASMVVEEFLKERGLKLDKGDEKITFALDDPKKWTGQLDARQRKLLEAFKALRSTITEMQKTAGVLKEEWPAGAISRLETERETLKNDGERKMIEARIEILKELGVFWKDTLDGGDIKNLRAELKSLKAEARSTDNQKKIDEIDAKIAKLSDREYMPMRAIAQAFIDKKLAAMNATQVHSISAKLRDFHAKRKGVETMADYFAVLKDAGLMTEEDMNPARMIMEMMADGYHRIAIKKLTDTAEAQGMIRENVDGVMNRADWVAANKIGVTLKGLKLEGGEPRYVHRVFANALRELAGVDREPRTWFDKLLTITKVGQFFVPGIIWSYNVIQRHMRGMGELNPFKAMSQSRQASGIFFGKGELYRKMNEYGLFQSPGLPTKASYDETMQLVVNRLQKGQKQWLKNLERVTQTRWSKDMFKGKNPGQTLLNALMIPYRATATITWAGDQIQRIESVLKFMDQNKRPEGMSDDAWLRTAVDYAASAHGAYAHLSAKYRTAMSRIFFVHTFRVLMPFEFGKSMYGLPRMMAQTALGRQKYNKYQWNLATKALLTTVFAPIAIDAMMRANDWEPDEEGMPELVKMFGKWPIGLPWPTFRNHWKYKKKITRPDGTTRELVVGINTIINMPQKWLNRATKDRPERLDDVFYHVSNVVKWEVNPLYRIFLDCAANQDSIQGKAITQRSKPIAAQVFDIGTYGFGSIFRMYHDIARGTESSAGKAEAKRDLQLAMNTMEKVMLGYATSYTKVGKLSPIGVGYPYSRADRFKRFKSAQSSLENAIAHEKTQLKKDFSDKPERYAEELRDLKQLEIRRKARLRKIFLDTEN